MSRPLIIALFSLLVAGCNLERSRDSRPVSYDTENPQIFILPPELDEVSGMAPTISEDTLLAIHDERGDLFYLSLEGKVLGFKTFHRGGDFEDIVVIGKSAFILKSNGNLSHIPDYTADSLTYLTYKPDPKFKEGLEFESLASDTLNSRLLLLVKDGEAREGKVPVYGFDLKNMVYFKDAVALLDPRAAPKVTVRGKDLHASGMSIHPLTGEWYVISSISRLLVVSDAKGNGITSKKLPKKIYPQPEGVCFLSDGTLFLTTEAKGKQAKLYRFNYLK